jgi:hypothetical protein
MTIEKEEAINPYKVNGLFRFTNKNGECYINSFLQILLHNEIILDKINLIKDIDNKMILVKELKRLLNDIKKKKLLLDPINIKNVMISLNNIYNNSGADINDFISDFIRELSSELPKKEKFSFKLSENEIINNGLNKLIKKFYSKHYSILTEIFYGSYQLNCICDKGHLVDAKFMMFLTIDLSIYSCINKEKINVEEILKEKFTLKKQNMISKYCNLCMKEVFYNEKEYFYTLPNIIILYFQRQYSDKFYNNKIDFPKDLFLEEFINNEEYKSSSKYHLIGIIQNNRGHFDSATINNYDKNWYYFNDDHQPIIINKEIFTFNPIILFYSK